MQDITVAVVQMQSQLGQISNNLNKIDFFSREAASKGADIICLPEMCVQGYDRERAGDLAVSLPGPVPSALSDIAKKYNIIILAGMAETSGCLKPFITHITAYPDGVLKKYRKTHLGHSEKPYFAAGDALDVFEAPKAKFAVQICWDLHFPEVSTILSLKGSEIFFAPHASPAIVGDRKGIWLKYLAARAYDNSVYLAACNLFGDNGAGQTFAGGALVLDPKGNLLAEAFNGKEETLLCRLRGDVINKIRYQKRTSMRDSFYLKGRRPELYRELL